MVRLQAGRFYVIGFGNGTQLIYVEAISKSGKRAEIRRCQAWKSAEANWDLTTSRISVSDPRVQEELERVPGWVPDLPGLEYAAERIAFHDAERRAWNEVAAEFRPAVEAARAAIVPTLAGLCTTPAECAEKGRHGDAGHWINCKAWGVYYHASDAVEAERRERTDARIEEVRLEIMKHEGQVRPVPR